MQAVSSLHASSEGSVNWHWVGLETTYAWFIWAQWWFDPLWRWRRGRDVGTWNCGGWGGYIEGFSGIIVKLLSTSEEGIFHSVGVLSAFQRSDMIVRDRPQAQWDSRYCLTRGSGRRASSNWADEVALNVYMLQINRESCLHHSGNFDQSGLMIRNTAQKPMTLGRSPDSAPAVWWYMSKPCVIYRVLVPQKTAHYTHEPQKHNW